MPYININFGDAESFEVLPEDNYPVEVEKVEVRENKDGDAYYLNWELVVVDTDYENRRLWFRSSLKETALGWLKKTFENLDLLDDEDEMELEYDDDIEPSTKSGPLLLYPDVEGLECIAKVKVGMYDGKEKNDVTDLYLERKPKKSTRSNSQKRSVSSREDGRETRQTKSSRRTSGRRRIR